MRAAGSMLAPLRLAGLSVAARAAGASTVRMQSTGAAHQPASETKWGVERTANNRIPVYRDIRNHNTRELTIIRKVHGDLESLRLQIIREFDVLPKDVWVKQGRVEIRGMHTHEMIAWLRGKGF
mmetsp:Transcript_2803/g.7158  ORF Transcript_2803/g.7158 Transcript_2803/m.7158 type:complete len:124 (-) Transcript_2803:63-434(-)